MADEEKTLEERVAALEETVSQKYSLAFSGEEIDTLLTFVSERKIRAGRTTAQKLSDTIYEAVTDIDYDAYSVRPVCLAAFCYSDNYNNEVELPTTGVTVRNSSGKVTFNIALPRIPPTSARTLWVKYIIMERT